MSCNLLVLLTDWCNTWDLKLYRRQRHLSSVADVILHWTSDDRSSAVNFRLQQHRHTHVMVADSTLSH